MRVCACGVKRRAGCKYAIRLRRPTGDLGRLELAKPKADQRNCALCLKLHAKAWAARGWSRFKPTGEVGGLGRCVVWGGGDEHIRAGVRLGVDFGSLNEGATYTFAKVCFADIHVVEVDSAPTACDFR